MSSSGTVRVFRAYAFPTLAGKTAGAFDFVAGGAELAFTFHWLGRHGHFVARLATDDDTLWWGSLEVGNGIVIRNKLPDQANVDIAFIVQPNVDDGTALKPSTATNFSILIFTGTGL